MLPRKAAHLRDSALTDSLSPSWSREGDACPEAECDGIAARTRTVAIGKVGQPDLTVLDECFPGRIAMTDVDGLVEIKGQFLFIEWKRGGDVPTGQRIMFERLTRHPEFTILVILGRSPGPWRWSATTCSRADGARAGRDCDLSELKNHVRAWADRASRATRVTR